MRMGQNGGEIQKPGTRLGKTRNPALVIGKNELICMRVCFSNVSKDYTVYKFETTVLWGNLYEQNLFLQRLQRGEQLYIAGLEKLHEKWFDTEEISHYNIGLTLKGVF